MSSSIKKLVSLLNDCQVKVFPCQKTSRAGKKYNSVGVIAVDPITGKAFWLNERYGEWDKGNKAKPVKGGKKAKAKKPVDRDDEDDEEDEDDEDEEDDE
jgi:hypothetical protein